MASRSDVKSILITADANAADDDSVFANQTRLQKLNRLNPLFVNEVVVTISSFPSNHDLSFYPDDAIIIFLVIECWHYDNYEVLPAIRYSVQITVGITSEIFCKYLEKLFA